MYLAFSNFPIASLNPACTFTYCSFYSFITARAVFSIRDEDCNKE